MTSKKSVLWNAIIGHLDRFSRTSIENKYMLKIFSYFITTKKFKNYPFLWAKMAAKFWFTKGLYFVVLNYQSYVVQKATRTQLKLKDENVIVNSLSWQTQSGYEKGLVWHLNGQF
jgi:hypothetical protein